MWLFQSLYPPGNLKQEIPSSLPNQLSTLRLGRESKEEQVSAGLFPTLWMKRRTLMFLLLRSLIRTMTSDLLHFPRAELWYLDHSSKGMKMTTMLKRGPILREEVLKEGEVVGSLEELRSTAEEVKVFQLWGEATEEDLSRVTKQPMRILINIRLLKWRPPLQGMRYFLKDLAIQLFLQGIRSQACLEALLLRCRLQWQSEPNPTTQEGMVWWSLSDSESQWWWWCLYYMFLL